MLAATKTKQQSDGWTYFLGLANSGSFRCAIQTKEKCNLSELRKEIISKAILTLKSFSVRIAESWRCQAHVSAVALCPADSLRRMLLLTRLSFKGFCCASLAHSSFSFFCLLKSQRRDPDSRTHRGEKRTGQFSLQAKPPSGFLDSKMPWVFPTSHGPQVWKSTGLSLKQGISLKPCL